MKIVYTKPEEIENFDIDRYLASLNKYGEVSKEQVEEGLKEFNYDPLHYSCLVELGVKLLPDDESAGKYYNDHPIENIRFDRLRRITGYLVGTLERFNDAKRAEVADRLTHSVGGQYDSEEKNYIEALKYENSVMSQI